MVPAPNSVKATYDAARLIKAHQAGVWRYLRVLGCDPALADDLTQETFIRVIESPFEELHEAATAAYLRRTAYNLYVSLRRKEGRTLDLQSLDCLTEQWASWVKHDQGEELLTALRECIQGLSERARRSLELRFGELQSREQIAATLNITGHGAKNLMQRAKHQLRRCIEGKLK